MLSVKDMLKVGVHLGHECKRWNPKMKHYIFGERNGIYIIDLQKTLHNLEKAHSFIVNTVSSGETVLFVGTKSQVQDVVENSAKKCGMFYVTQRWLGGMLTNFGTIKKSVVRLKDLEGLLGSEIGTSLTKKEMLRLEKKRIRMNNTLCGVKDMDRLPGVVIVVDPRVERIAVSEAKKLGIPVIALIDTNCDPSGIDHVIPCNDDSARSVSVLIASLMDAINEGRKLGKDKGKVVLEEKTPVKGAKKAQVEETGKKQNKETSQKEELAIVEVESSGT